MGKFIAIGFALLLLFFLFGCTSSSFEDATYYCENRVGYWNKLDCSNYIYALSPLPFVCGISEPVNSTLDSNSSPSYKDVCDEAREAERLYDECKIQQKLIDKTHEEELFNCLKELGSNGVA